MTRCTRSSLAEGSTLRPAPPGFACQHASGLRRPSLSAVSFCRFGTAVWRTRNHLRRSGIMLVASGRKNP